MNKKAKLYIYLFKKTLFILIFLALITLSKPSQGTQKVTLWNVSDPKNNISEKLIAGGRLEVKRKPIYHSAYYLNGYPPESEGVCTDLIWRALMHADFNLKNMMDQDIKRNPKLYLGANGKPDPNIDFRRVPNQLIFFKQHAESLTLLMDIKDEKNMEQWQAGDLVTFKNPNHIGILSTKKNKQGIFYLIHNSGPIATEDDAFEFWYAKGLTGHFRLSKNFKPFNLE